MGQHKDLAQDRSTPFVPLRNEDASFIYVVPKSQFGPELIANFIRAVDPQVQQDRVDAHTSFLMRRSGGEQFLRDEDEYCTPKTKSVGRLAFRFGMPVYSFQLQDRKCRWTVDIFNPKNLECRLPIHDDNHEYIELILDSSGVKPYVESMAYWKPFEALVERHEFINNKLLSIYSATKPLFVFGSAVDHLGDLSLLFHYGKGRSWRRASYADYFWQHAIYPVSISSRHPVLAELQAHTQSCLLEEQRRPKCAKPDFSLHIERSDDSSLCVWTPVTSTTEDGMYARRLGLTSILSADYRALPMG